MGAAARWIGRPAHLAWGVGSLGTITYLNAVTSVGLIFLTQVLQISPGVAGTLLTAARVFDAFSDPAMGYLTDRTKSRWGRRRPWLLAGAILCGIMLPLFYAIPRAADESTTIIMVLAVLIIYSLGFTIFNVPYMTMPIEMSRDHQERVAIMSHRVVFLSLGSFAGASLAPAVLDWLGRDAAGFAQMGLIFGAVVCVAMLIAFLGTRSIPQSVFTPSHLPLREQFRTALENRPFALLMGVKVLQFVGIAAHSSTMAYFVTTVLQRDFNVMLLYGVVAMISTVLSVSIWRSAARRISKRNGFVIGVVGYILMTLTWLLATPEEPLFFIGLRALIMGFFTSAILLFGQAVWVDAVDYDYRRTGIKREGLFTSVYVFVERLGYSTAPLLLGWLLEWFHFDKRLPLEQQPESASSGVLVSLIAVPAVTFALSLFFLAKYDLTDAKLDATRPPATGS
jgi:GPH family glycoside/pentoside/hexuronide:cation symporter